MSVTEIINSMVKTLTEMGIGNLKRKLSYIAKVLAIECDAKRISIMIPDIKKSKLLIAGSVGIWDEIVDLINNSDKISVSPVANYVYKTGKEVIFNTKHELDKFIGKNSGFDFFHFKRDDDTHVFCSTPFIMAPVEDNKKTIGVLNISDKVSITDKDRELINSIKPIICETIKLEKNKNKSA